MDRKLLPAFIWTARPLEIPIALNELSPESEVLVSNGRGGTGIVRAGEYIKELREVIERQSNGFYTVQEASHIFAALVPGLTQIAWQEKMKDAWRIGELVIRDTTRTKKSVKAADVSYMDLVKEFDLDAWLVKDGAGFLFSKVGPCVKTSDVGALDESSKAGHEKPVQRTAAQDYAILSEIKRQGFNPLALPKNPDGKPGVKAAIRTALLKQPLFTGSTVFDKAWERLAARADIVIQS